MPRIQDNLTVGDAQISPTAPSHIAGVKQGNARDGYRKMKGHEEDGTSGAARSTGIDPEAREPILPSMPNLSPA